jgi:hypothetical protein
MFLKRIKDIRISNNTISVIRDANISIIDLEKQIGQIEYSPAQGTKNTVAENIKSHHSFKSFTIYTFVS